MLSADRPEDFVITVEWLVEVAPPVASWMVFFPLLADVDDLVVEAGGEDIPLVFVLRLG